MEKVVNTFIFLLLLFVNVEIKAGSLSTADRLDIIDMMNKYGLAVEAGHRRKE
mgnify:CR=1 FL=1